MPETENTQFTNAKDLYFKKIALPLKKQSETYTRGLKISNDKLILSPDKSSPGYDPESKYARAARLGLCFKCLREDTNPNHRPKHRIFAYCKECDEDFAIGTEKLVVRAQNEVERWFPNG